VNQKVNVDRRLLKRIRAMLHDMTVNGIDTAPRRHFKLKDENVSGHRTSFLLRLEGYLNFVGQVRGNNDWLFLKMKSNFDDFLKDTGEKGFTAR
jgi:RNA-directed DNA polymerase